MDIIVGDIAVTKEREMVMDFTFPFYYGYSTVILKRPNPDEVKWRKLVDPLTVSVKSTIVLTGQSQYIYLYLGCFYDNESRKKIFMILTYYICFQWPVVVAIIGTLIFASAIVHLLEKHNSFYGMDGERRSFNTYNCRRVGNIMQSFFGAIGCLFASLFMEGTYS